VLLPVSIEAPQEVDAVAPTPAPALGRPATGTIEIDIGGARVRLRGVVDDATVRCVLESLRGAA
jgi:transposase